MHPAPGQPAASALGCCSAAPGRLPPHAVVATPQAGPRLCWTLLSSHASAAGTPGIPQLCPATRVPTTPAVVIWAGGRQPAPRRVRMHPAHGQQAGQAVEGTDGQAYRFESSMMEGRVNAAREPAAAAVMRAQCVAC